MRIWGSANSSQKRLAQVSIRVSNLWKWVHKFHVLLLNCFNFIFDLKVFSTSLRPSTWNSMYLFLLTNKPLYEFTYSNPSLTRPCYIPLTTNFLCLSCTLFFRYCCIPVYFLVYSLLNNPPIYRGSTHVLKIYRIYVYPYHSISIFLFSISTTILPPHTVEEGLN